MTDAEPRITFPVATGLDIGYSREEDRLVLVLRTAGHGKRAVFLTRRMMRVLLGHHATLLRRTSPAAARAPAGQRDEVLRMEHVSALADPPAAPADPPAPAATEAPPTAWLATEIKLRSEGEADTLLIGFLGHPRPMPADEQPQPEPVAAMTLNRADAHRVLDLLVRKCAEAQWSLEGEAAWLVPREAGRIPPVMN